MANPDELLANLDQAVQEVEKAKKAILSLPRDSADSIKALYRLAMYMLHEEHNLDGAKDLFHKLANCTVKCDSRAEARLSYGLMMWAHGEFDNAIKMLKRVASEEENPQYQALALDYLATFMREHNASKPTLAKIDEQRVSTLQVLVDAEPDKRTKADYQLRLDAAKAEQQV